MRFERKNAFSSRREGPQTPAEASAVRAVHEARAKDFKQSLSAVPPWERPGFVEEMQNLSPTETPVPKSAVQFSKPKKERLSSPDLNERPSVRAIQLNKKIQDRYQAECAVSTVDAEDLYGEDLHNLELIIQRLLKQPDDVDTLRALEEMERRYR